MYGLRRAGAMALAVTLGLTLVACGGDDDDDAVKAAIDAGLDGEVDFGDFTGECAAFIGAFAGASAAIGSAFGGAPSEDLERAAEYFKSVADDIPKEIRADFKVFADAYTAFAQALVEADIDFSDPQSVDPERMAEISQLAEAFSDPEVAEASSRVEAYLTERCGADGLSNG